MNESSSSTPALRATPRATSARETPRGSTPSYERVLRAVLVFVAASLATRIAFVGGGFLNVDEAAHVMGARTLTQGGELLYVDFVDNKPPLIYAFYALSMWLFGDGIASVRWMGALVLVPSIALAASAFYGHGRRGLAAGLAFVVASASLLAADTHAVHCEHLMILPVAWSFVLLRARRFRRVPLRVLGAGALLGLAVLAKQPALLFLPTVAALMLLDRDGSLLYRSTRVALLLVGAAFPWAIFAAWMGARGTLDDAEFWIWQFNATHVVNPMTTSEQVSRALLFGASLLPAMLPLALALILGRGPMFVHGRQRLWLLGMFVAALAPAFLGMRLFGHYFLPAVFVLSLAAGPWFARRRGRSHAAIGAFALVCLSVVTMVGIGVHRPSSAIADVSRPSYERIGRELTARAARSGLEECSIFVWGYAPMIYVYADAEPASRFVVPLDSVSGYLAGNDAVIEGRVDTSDRIRPEHWEALEADLRAHRPCFIVDTAPANLNGWGSFPIERFPRLRTVIEHGYVADEPIEGVAVYVRR